MKPNKEYVSIHDVRPLLVRPLLPGELTRLGDFFDIAGPEDHFPDLDPLLECEVGIVVPLNHITSNKYYRLA